MSTEGINEFRIVLVRVLRETDTKMGLNIQDM